MSSTPQPGVSEMQNLHAHFDAGKKAFLASIEGVSEEQARFSPGEGCWSILHVAEHVAVAERQMLTLWNKLSVPGSSPLEKDAMVLSSLGDRKKKNPAPERSVPSGRFTSLQEARDAFLATRETVMATLNSAASELRAKVVEHPLAGVVDGYQLFLVIALHPLRHAHQVNEIKTHPAYPRANT